ncbi:MAG: RtcB family protein, partial [Chitinophagales bacterium]|nr:RtcB family protein [Chitinophagales bacterium]
MGYAEGRAIGIALDVMQKNYKHSTKKEALQILKEVIENPPSYMQHPSLSKVAEALTHKINRGNVEISLHNSTPDYNVFGPEQIEAGAIKQMDVAMRLPITIAGALMPDAHQGYGLPIGGVLATENSVIPYGVGVDIGCRMCLSVYNLPETMLKEDKHRLEKILVQNTLFGAGKDFSKSSDHPAVERHEFDALPLLKSLQSKAAKQLGSSGSGNHFVEFGFVEIPDKENDWRIPAGKYLGVLSHSGSRGLGASIASHYTKVAMEKCRLPSEAKHLAWLSLDSEEGQEYWMAMNVAGDYAAACHHLIHEKISNALAEKPVRVVENHHNFAWKETHYGKEVIVHRKGATP